MFFAFWLKQSSEPKRGAAPEVKLELKAKTQDWQQDLEALPKAQGTQGLSVLSKVKSKMKKVRDYNRNFYWEQTKRVHGFLWQIKTGCSTHQSLHCAPSQLQILVNGARGDFFCSLFFLAFWFKLTQNLRTTVRSRNFKNLSIMVLKRRQKTKSGWILSKWESAKAHLKIREECCWIFMEGDLLVQIEPDDD